MEITTPAPLDLDADTTASTEPSRDCPRCPRLVEVREKLGVVAVEGRGPTAGTKAGETTYLKPVFTAVLAGYSWTSATPKDLETMDLSARRWCWC